VGGWADCKVSFFSFRSLRFPPHALVLKRNRCRCKIYVSGYFIYFCRRPTWSVLTANKRVCCLGSLVRSLMFSYVCVSVDTDTQCVVWTNVTCFDVQRLSNRESEAQRVLQIHPLVGQKITMTSGKQDKLRCTAARGGVFKQLCLL
jgi:hypothetical protein